MEIEVGLDSSNRNSLSRSLSLGHEELNSNFICAIQRKLV